MGSEEAPRAGRSAEDFSQSMKTWRNVTIEISNRSEIYTLSLPKVHIGRGYCFHPPQPTIEKNTKGVCCFSKRARVACGTFGVLTYQILSDRKECIGDLTIMFSVPFDYNWFQNWFALGISDPGSSCDERLFKKMYYDTGSFNRERGTGSIATYSQGDVLVKGNMSGGGSSVMIVELWDV